MHLCLSTLDISSDMVIFRYSTDKAGSFSFENEEKSFIHTRARRRLILLRTRLSSYSTAHEGCRLILLRTRVVVLFYCARGCRLILLRTRVVVLFYCARGCRLILLRTGVYVDLKYKLRSRM